MRMSICDDNSWYDKVLYFFLQRCNSGRPGRLSITELNGTYWFVWGTLGGLRCLPCNPLRREYRGRRHELKNNQDSLVCSASGCPRNDTRKGLCVWRDHEWHECVQSSVLLRWLPEYETILGTTWPHLNSSYFVMVDVIYILFVFFFFNWWGDWEFFFF